MKFLTQFVTWKNKRLSRICYHVMSMLFILLITMGCASAVTTPASEVVDEPAAPTPEVMEEPATPTPEVVEEPATPTPEVVEEWVIATSEDAENLNPHTMSTLGSEMMNRQVLEPLLAFEGPNLELVPKLAESWEVLADNVTWVFHLRKGVKFHNGEEFNAEAVKFSFDLYQQEESKRYFYIGGLVDRTEVIDDYTVHLVLTQPSRIILSSMVQLTILPPKYYQEVGAEEFGKAPIGTGPYKLLEWRKGERMVFERYEEYWGPKPFPDRLVFRPIKEPSTRVAELLAGGVDIIQSLPLEQVSDIEAREDLEVLPVKGARQMVFPFNQTHEPFDDVRVRLAMNLAVDRDPIVQEILQGFGTPLRGPNFAPGTIGYNPNVSEYPYDPERAKELLAEAGYPDGFEADWLISSGAFIKDLEIEEAVAGQLAEIGVNLNLIVTERPTMVAGFMEGDFIGMTSTTWGTIKDPDIWLSWNMISRPSFVDQTAIDMLMESKVIMDPDERDALFQELFQYLHDNPVWLYVVATDDIYAAKKGLGWQPYPLRGDLGYTYFWIPGEDKN